MSRKRPAEEPPGDHAEPDPQDALEAILGALVETARLRTAMVDERTNCGESFRAAEQIRSLLAAAQHQATIRIPVTNSELDLLRLLQQLLQQLSSLCVKKCRAHREPPVQRGRAVPRGVLQARQ